MPHRKKAGAEIIYRRLRIASVSRPATAYNAAPRHAERRRPAFDEYTAPASHAASSAMIGFEVTKRRKWLEAPQKQRCLHSSGEQTPPAPPPEGERRAGVYRSVRVRQVGGSRKVAEKALHAPNQPPQPPRLPTASKEGRERPEARNADSSVQRKKAPVSVQCNVVQF